MKIGTIELTKERLIMVIGAIAVICTLGIYLVFYLPLMKGLKAKYSEYKATENDLFECRNIIEPAERVGRERALTAEEDISRAIDELTSYGRLRGINFISISPKEIIEEKDLRYKVLPIEIEIESTYNELGAFLGSVDELEKGLFKVKSFEIAADKKDASRLITDLVVNIYLSKDTSLR